MREDQEEQESSAPVCGRRLDSKKDGNYKVHRGSPLTIEFTRISTAQGYRTQDLGNALSQLGANVVNKPLTKSWLTLAPPHY